MNPMIRYLLLSLSYSALVFSGPAKRTCDSTDLRVAPPVMGYVFDQILGQIRTAAGIPGAARVSYPVKLDFKLRNAIVGAGGAVAVASVPEGSALTVINALNSEPVPAPIEGSMADFNFGAFNRTATAAIIYGSDCNCIQVTGGWPDTPRVFRSIDASSFSGAVVSLAVSDDQSMAAVAVAGSEDGSSPPRVLLFDLAGDSAPPPILAPASSLLFTANGKDLVMTDAAAGSISMGLNAGGVVDVGGTPASPGGEAISNPGAIAFTGTGLLLIADRAGFVHIIDLQTNERRSVGCSCRPDSMERMADQSIFRLTAVEAGAVWILDMSGENPRTWFIPIDALVDAPAEAAQ
ncbi:MAG: hypothetical protein ABJF23_02410 [Bryobacteraceae bacterium]